jgi:WD40 repeat protein
LCCGNDPYHVVGKIIKGHLDASGTTDGLGIGNPNEEFTPNVTCIGLSSRGGTGRVVWGFRNGEIAVTSAPRVMDSNRPPARFMRCRVDDGHAGDVLCVLFAGREDELVVTGCSHGQVKLWDARRMRCLWTGFGTREGAILSDPCVKVEYCARAKALVAYLQSRDLVVWWGFQLRADGVGGQMAIIGSVHALRIAHPVQSTIADGKPVESLFVDYDSSPSKVRILVRHADEQYFLRFAIDIPSGLVATTRFCDGPIGPLTSLKPCFPTQHRNSGLSTAAITPVNTGTASLPLNNAADLTASRETSFVLAGDTLGRVCVWNWDADGSVVENQLLDPSTPMTVDAQVNSSRKWEAHDDGAVCAIEMNSLVIVTGRFVLFSLELVTHHDVCVESVRGTLKVWDCLTFAPLRSFASPATKPSLSGQWDPVGQIILRGDLLVASVGNRILVWQAGAVVADKKGKAKHTGKPKERGAGNTLSKWQRVYFI